MWNELLFDCFIYYRMFWNSIGYSVIITLVQLVVVVPCAFGLVMLNNRLTKGIKAVYWLLMMMPLQVTILPNYIGLRDMGVLNTPFCVVLPMVFSVLGVIIMCQYMEHVDWSQIEAARLETDSIITILWKIVCPNLKVCIFAVGMFTFVESYNMLEQPMLFIKDTKWQTLSVFIANAGEYEGNVLFPAAVIFIIPVLLLYLLFNQNLREGIVIGEIRKNKTKKIM